MTKFFLCLFIFTAGTSFAQNTDSLWKVYDNNKQPDTNRLKAIHDIAWSYRNNKPDTAVLLAEQQLKLAQACKQKLYEGRALNTMGVALMNKGNYLKSLEYYLSASKIFEETGFKKGVGGSYNNIGNIYKHLAQYSKALDYYFKSLKVYEEIGNKPGVGMCNMNVGIVYAEKRNYAEALNYFFKALKIKEELGDKESVAHSYSNIAEVYGNQYNYAKATEYHLKGLKIRKELGDKWGTAISYIGLGELYLDQSDYKKTVAYNDSAIQVCKETGDINVERVAFQTLAEAYRRMGNYKQAFEAHVEFKKLTDSIFSAENSRQLGDMKTKFEVEKKEAELKAKTDAQELINAAEKKKQRFILVLVSGVLLLVVVFAVFMYRRFKITQRQKRIIELQKEKVEEQKNLIEQHQQEILDSITYAQRLQQAILPPQEFISRHVPDNFILYKPKDIVAGDFYWAEFINGKFHIAAADSTGHGVPGAMVSVVCSNALNRAVNEFQLTETGLILDKTRELVIETFKKSDKDVKDGMDISLLCIDQAQQKIFWSGANNPLWYIEDNEVKELKADKQPVGKSYDSKPFTTNAINYRAGITFYLFTDGLADQFGGPKGKKFKYKQFEELLVSVSVKTMQEQSDIINRKFDEWKGPLEQIDDVCVIGIKI